MDSGTTDIREPREDRRYHLRLTVALILWPTILAGAGNAIMTWTGVVGEGWRYLEAVPIAVHLGVVAVGPAAALSVAVGRRVIRSRQPRLVFLIVPLVALVTTGLGIPLHYVLLGVFWSLSPVVTSLSVMLLSVLIGLILSKGTFPHGR